MSTTWFLVAERAGATIFEHRQDKKTFAVHQSVAHPEGRLESHEMGSDRKGRTYESHGVGGSAFEPQHTPAENVADQFAQQLAGIVRDARNLHAYDRLVLVAEPRFLGRLRGALDHATADTVVGSIDKDLAHATVKDVEAHVSHLFPA